MIIDVTGLRKKYADYPNILRYIELLLRHGKYSLLEWVEKQAPAELSKIGMTIDDAEEFLGHMLSRS